MSIMAQALADKEPNLLHIPSCDCLELSQFMVRDLMQQRLDDAIFDNSKIKSIASGWKTQYNSEKIVLSTLMWLNEDVRRKRISKDLDNKLEVLTDKYIGLGVN